MDHNFIQNLTLIVQENLQNEDFGPEQLVEIIGKSHSTIHRRVKEYSGQSISQFIRAIRLNAAKELLLNEEDTIAEISYKVGFGSPTYFNKCFHDEFGMPPGEFKKKFRSKKTGTRHHRLFYLLPVLLLLVFFLIPNHRFSLLANKNNTEKTIAVLPFNYLGSEKEKQHFSNVMMLEITSKLSMVENLVVLSIPAIDTDKKEPNNQLVKKLGVNYLLKGNLHIAGNKMKLIVNLTNTKNGEIEWSETFNSGLENILEIESNISQAIAQQVNAFITPDEKARMRKIPTLSSEANDFYQSGRAAHMEYWQNNSDLVSLSKAEDYYQKALNNDSTFAQAYVGLAQIAYDKTTWSDIFKNTYLDTVLSLANRALSFDNTLSDAYTLRGDYYRARFSDKAIVQYQQALHFNPNSWQAYYGLGNFYLLQNSIKSAQNILEATKRRRGPEYPIMLDNLAFIFILNGLFDEGQELINRKLLWDNDSLYYYRRLALIEEYKEHFEKAAGYALKARAIDSTNLNANSLLAFNYVLLKEFKKATYYNERIVQISNNINFKLNNEHHRIGYVYLVNGDKQNATKYFHRQIDASQKLIAMGNAEEALYDLAATYAILNENDKAFENLKKVQQQNTNLWFIYFYMKNDPLLNTIRNEPAFQEILNRVKTKAETERNKLKNWAVQQKLFARH
ncbi:helix-turn-helix domain-containing protein [Draconibacterium halophilum]|uniref:Helix-turn-helix domain-containing protein n=1 Tax=Draconibacterium halophilum TaxID=2706887 RepID=A0A6C0RHY9_9BACT|nr:helix-turn-helix domain-containing protein [Draconibacterium halophilum]QIA09452.1 helix-turn-helix domain-containing protein [Draconibacterium halophilum]